MILRITDDGDSAAAGFDFIAFGDALRGVVRALGVKIGANLTNDGPHVSLGKNDHRIDIRKGGENLGALIGRHHGPSGSFERADRIVAIYGDDKPAPELPRRMQVSNVPDMQDIEATIGERDALTRATPRLHTPPKLGARNDLRML